MYLEDLPSFRCSDPMLQYVEYVAIFKFYAKGDSALMAQRYKNFHASKSSVIRLHHKGAKHL